MSEQKIKSIFIPSCYIGDFYEADNKTKILKEYYSDDVTQTNYLECYRAYKNNALKIEIRATRNNEYYIIIEYDV
jgi:hypothetical protein